MARPLQQEYDPNPVPSNLDDIPRFLFEELERIKVALYAQPVALSINETGTWAVTTVVTWETLFIGETPGWEVPGGGFDSTTGIWTCPQAGLYDFGLQAEIEPFGGGNKNYYAGLRLFVRHPDLSIDTYESTDGGADDVPLGVSLSGLIPLVSGDELLAEMTIVHEIFVGSVNYEARMQILRESA